MFPGSVLNSRDADLGSVFLVRENNSSQSYSRETYY